MNNAALGFTIGDVARRFAIPTWKVRRLFERGLLTEPRRIGFFRVVSESELPTIEACLRQCGYLPPS
jgi:DNA-binding transcriptional MerR regulator